MSIDIASIMGKVRAYSQTPAGKAKMKEAVERMRREGRTRTAAGSRLMSPAEMESAALRLADAIRKAAQSYDLPASVMNNVNSLAATKPYQTEDGGWRVDLYFTDDLSRESLYPEEYEGGVANIIALFNNGYLANDFVYGWWDGHKPTGEESKIRSGTVENSAFVRSRLARPGLQFMQKAVEDFNATVGKATGARAVLAPIYEEVPSYTG